jgi:outer membrane lipopolysaccharide assembly protein LptE/RlpB
MHLILGQFNEDKRAVSITTNAVASEYQLTLSQQFSLIYESKNQPSVNLINNATARVSQSYNYNGNAVLSSSREESQIRESLLNQLTSQLLRRLAPFNTNRIASELNAQKKKANH